MSPATSRTRPEDYIGAAGRPFTGQEYLESLRDGREVYVYGERLADVTAHPAFRNSVRTIAKLYDALHDPALIYLPSSALDVNNPEISKYLAKYVRGSNGIGYRERIKIMKLLWDAVGTEFGGRHELYEMNYAGNHEDIRIQAMFNARGSGALDGMIALTDACLADYDEHGWKDKDLDQSRRCVELCLAPGARGGVG
jgi:aromatic ring hydroxylase